MRCRILNLSSRLLVAGAGVGVALGLNAQIAFKSPFLPPSPATAAAIDVLPLEFQAMMQTEDGMLYRVYHASRKTGTWAKTRERDAALGVLVKRYDAERMALTVEYEGRSLTLPENKFTIVSTGAPVAPTGSSGPAVPQAIVRNGTPGSAAAAQEQSRLEATAAEIAKRRVLREQMSLPSPGPQPEVQVTRPVR